MFSLHIFSSLLKGAENTVGFVLMTLVRTLFYHLCGLIYWGLRGFCNVFFALCNGQLLDTETLNSLFGRVGLLLGVIMMFRVAFSFIQVLISPDAFSDPEKGIPNIIKKSIIVIIMFGMSSYVFSFLRTLQGEIIESNVISKFLLPQQVETDNFGGAIEAELFTAFYNLDPSLNYDTSNECATEDYINGLKNEIAENNSFDYKTECVNEAGKIKDTDDKQFFIKFNFIFSILIGIVACYFFINYCISVGVRVIQLAFLQIISPMAIVGYLSPNKGDNMFNKWLKVYFSTYIDVFLRMAIINFAIYLIAILIEGYNNADSVFFASVGYANGSTKTLIFIFMVMAILTFAKKAPDLLKKIFPATSESGISLGLDKDNKSAIGMAAGTVAGVGIGAAGFGLALRQKKKNGEPIKFKDVRSGLGGIVTSVGRGAKAGFDKGGLSGFGAGREAQAKANMRRIENLDTPFRERASNKISDITGVGSAQYSSYEKKYNAGKDIKSDITNDDNIKHLEEAMNRELQQMSQAVNAIGKKQYTAGEVEARRKKWQEAINVAQDEMFIAAKNDTERSANNPIEVKAPDGSTINIEYNPSKTLHAKIEQYGAEGGNTTNFKSFKDDLNTTELKMTKSHKGNAGK